MIAVGVRGALGTEGDDDRGLPASEKAHDLADDDIGVRRGERAVRESAELEALESENSRSRLQFGATARSQVLTRADGDPGRSSGIAVSGTIQVTAHTVARVPRDRTADRKDLVVRMGEDRGDRAGHALIERSFRASRRRSP